MAGVGAAAPWPTFRDMQTTTDHGYDVIQSMNTLLRGEISAVETYHQALERVKDAQIRPILEENLRLHQNRCDLLRARVQSLGGTPEASSGAWGAFAKLIEGGAQLFGDKAAVIALEEGEDRGLAIYRKELPKLDATTQQLVETQLFAGQQTTHGALSALKKQLHGTK